MSEYYAIRFHADCEECGRRFEGVFWALVPNEDDAALSGALSSGMKAAAQYADARNTKKGLERRLRDRRWTELATNGIGRGVSYPGPHEHCCPRCGARQSWDLMAEPTEPKKTSGVVGYIVFGAFLLGIVGMLVGLFAMAFTLEHDAFFVCLGVGVVLGALAGRSMGRSINKDEIASYEGRLDAYRRDKEAYEAFQEALARRTVRNEPEPEFETGCFAPEIPWPDDIGKFQPGNCPSCGRRLEGTVRMNSVEAGRAAAGNCPWCGATLPVGRRVTLR